MKQKDDIQLQRIIRRKTQKEVAEAIGKTREYISMIENGKRTLTPELRAQILGYLKKHKPIYPYK